MDQTICCEIIGGIEFLCSEVKQQTGNSKLVILVIVSAFPAFCIHNISYS